MTEGVDARPEAGTNAIVSNAANPRIRARGTPRV